MGHYPSRPNSLLGAPSTVEMTRPELFAAFEYISKHLIRNGIHLQLIITGRSLSVLRFRSALSTPAVSVLQTTPIDRRTFQVLTHYVHKASLKFGFAQNWIHNDLETTYSPAELHVLSTRSLLQNDVVFSSEGLTLLSVDYCFALKDQLGLLTKTCSMDELQCTAVLLRKLINAYRGRPLTKGYIARCYSGIHVSDFALLRVNAMYEWKYGVRGIVGVNDEFLAWRREGRYDLDTNFELNFGDLVKNNGGSSPTTSSGSSSPCESLYSGTELDPARPLIVRFNTTASEECSTPTSVRSVDMAGMEKFLREYNTF